MNEIQFDHFAEKMRMIIELLRKILETLEKRDEK